MICNVPFAVKIPVDYFAVAVVFGLQTNDCEQDLVSIVEQLKAEVWGMA